MHISGTKSLPQLHGCTLHYVRLQEGSGVMCHSEALADVAAYSESGEEPPLESFEQSIQSAFFNSEGRLVIPCGGGINIALPAMPGLAQG